MTRIAASARWIAIAIAVVAVIDPVLSLPRSERPVVRVVSLEPRDVRPIAGALRDAGFQIDGGDPEAAIVLVGRSASREHLAVSAAHPASATKHAVPGTEHPAVWALDTSPPSPNIRLARVLAPASRLPMQAVEIKVDMAAHGAAGQTTEIVLEERGIPVAIARHRWSGAEESREVSLHYLPPGAAATRLRVRASALPFETDPDDNVADVAIPALRGPVRVLVVEAAVTWPAVFVRRALEGEPAFAVSAIQRAAKGVATTAGAPPAALTRAALAPFEVVFIGGPDVLTAADLVALRWFVEERGGIAIFIPDQRPTGRYLELVGVSTFVPRILDAPVRVAPDLQASELLIAARLPPAATVLASQEGSPVVFAARRGAGAVVFSGALDAWRHRADAPAQTADSTQTTAPLARFWQGVVFANAAAVPSTIDVSAVPGLVRPGERTSITVRLRDIPVTDVMTFPPVSARIVGATIRADQPVRLWPTAEPGVYEGAWRAGPPGQYNLTVTAGELRGDGTITVAGDVAQPAAADPESLAILTAAAGGQVFPVERVPALVQAMRSAHPPRRVVRPVHPMRSAWWLLPFAGLLCAEWAIRRKRGLP